MKQKNAGQNLHRQMNCFALLILKCKTQNPLKL